MLRTLAVATLVAAFAVPASAQTAWDSPPLISHVVPSGVSLFVLSPAGGDFGALVTFRHDAGPVGETDHGIEKIFDARIGQRIHAHAQQGRRIDVQCDQIGVSGLKIGYLVDVGILRAADAAGGQLTTNGATTVSAGMTGTTFSSAARMASTT